MSRTRKILSRLANPVQEYLLLQDQSKMVGSGGSSQDIVPESVQKAVAAEKASENGAKKSRLDLQSLPTRQYLDQTVVPALQQALSVLSKERPPDPIEFLATFLLKNKSQYDGSSGAGPS
ncbi:protein dpy-30 homolog isoform X1 [Amphibalanus amphitrite]|uniref:protein dpy-30 homolog isoform X1 n=1 Tax=Amphibalanus amphitrite TaxID=1232801 RepID=UPI001C92B9DF|nr:protein dpy-30 homolog isoform X1 [Amphibalanus amphitrite]